MQEYLKLPLRFNYFFEKRRFPVCSLYNSISYNIHLLATTILGENTPNMEYGSSFWDDEFDIQLSSDKRTNNIIRDLENSIGRFERRLTEVSVSVAVKQAETTFISQKHLKRRIEINVSGRIVRSNEPFNFVSGFFIGPYLFE
jgi:predicted component of type VI protein secretion system